MSIAERDYLLRMIERLAATIAAILAKKREGKLDEALAMAEAARRDLVGSMDQAISKVDAASATTILGGYEKARVYATLLALEGDLRAERGATESAKRSWRRARDIHRSAIERWPDEARDEDRSAIAALDAKLA